jgi:trk system potassium uptake protein TrkA
VVGRRVDEIELPKGATIGAVVRETEVLMGHHDTVIESEDHVIVFVINKQMIRKIEKLFQVKVGFF